MNFRLTKGQLAHLSVVGLAIDGGQQPTVFDGGIVGIGDATESEVMKDVAGQKTGSPAGSRPGRRARARRAQTPDHAFRSDALEATHGAGFRILAQHYEALGFEDRNGLWVVVTSKPLGGGGPEVHFLIGVPTDQRIAPRAWAFEMIGPNAKAMSLKHTNFPDASICAFPHGHLPWPNAGGLIGLVDIFILWVIRKLHRDYLGWWPGPQVGACAYYRLKEFCPREDCGCGSTKRYGDCHMGRDLLLNPERAAAEFERLFECRFNDRRTPKAIIKFAQSNWRKTPAMSEIFATRKDPSGLTLP